MKFKQLSQYKTLGVINMTPNSFSDHGVSLNPEHFTTQLTSFLKDPTIIIDVGFESTAPMNSAITFEEELKRFDNFLLASKPFSFKDRFVSFDTYKVESFKIMSEKFLAIHPGAYVIFNDVSGVLNTELIELLKTFSKTFKDRNFYYIYTFSHIPSRDLTLKHMSFADENIDVIMSAAQSFIKAYECFKSFQMEDQLILDAGFGFSKTYDQNWALIDHYGDLIKTIHKTHPEITNPHLVGLSKKSFLKKKLGGDCTNEELENLHIQCLKSIQKQTSNKLLFRMHNPFIL